MKTKSSSYGFNTHPFIFTFTLVNLLATFTLALVVGLNLMPLGFGLGALITHSTQMAAFINGIVTFSQAPILAVVIATIVNSCHSTQDKPPLQSFTEMLTQFEIPRRDRTNHTHTLEHNMIRHYPGGIPNSKQNSFYKMHHIGLLAAALPLMRKVHDDIDGEITNAVPLKTIEF